jgi:N-acetylglucosaminyldiphosphoundecaprenol N-acetyl-beta-D-mannosaminyltransferase
MTSGRVHLFGIQIDRVSLAQAVARVRRWVDAPWNGCHFIVTPNLDHIVRLRRDFALQRAYASASLVVADGWPVVAASRLFGVPLPERVAGSDLVPALLATAADRPLRVFLLGAMPGVGDRAAENIHKTWPGTEVCGTFSPPLGFHTDPEQNAHILSRINATQPDLLVVGLGAPKQEIWLAQHYARLECKVAIAAGATIDFLAGEQRRAPPWLQRWNLEWLYRMVNDPRRLAKRYLHDAVEFPWLLWSEWNLRRKGYHVR